MAEGLDVVVGAGFLGAELVAGKAEDGEVIAVFFLEGFVEFFEAFVLWGETAFGGGVDDEDDFSFVAFEGDRGAFFCWTRWLVHFADPEDNGARSRRTI